MEQKSVESGWTTWVRKRDTKNVRTQLRMNEDETTDVDATEQTCRWRKNRKGAECKKGANGSVKKKWCTGTKRLKHALLFNSRAEMWLTTMQMNWFSSDAQCIHIRGEKKSCAWDAWTLPRTRQRGAKACPQDGETMNVTLRAPNSGATNGGTCYLEPDRIILENRRYRGVRKGIWTENYI